MHDTNVIMDLRAWIDLHFERNGGPGALAQVGLERRAPRGNTLVNTGLAFSPRINLPERVSSDGCPPRFEHVTSDETPREIDPG